MIIKTEDDNTKIMTISMDSGMDSMTLSLIYRIVERNWVMKESQTLHLLSSLTLSYHAIVLTCTTSSWKKFHHLWWSGKCFVDWWFEIDFYPCSHSSSCATLTVNRVNRTSSKKKDDAWILDCACNSWFLVWQCFARMDLFLVCSLVNRIYVKIIVFLENSIIVLSELELIISRWFLSTYIVIFGVILKSLTL